MQRLPAPRRVGIADVARAAGVSVPTVSKVVNGRVDVAAATRERVQRVIDDLGYVAGRAARSLRKGSSGLIDVAVEALDGDYMSEIIRGVEEALGEHDLRLVLSVTGGDSRREQRWVSNVTDGSTDGAILVVARGQSEQVAELSRRGLPFVLVDHRGEIGPSVPAVGATNFAGGRAATEHLLSLGHQRIAVIGGPADMPCSQDRIAGYRAALDAAGVRADDALIRPGGWFNLEAGARETQALLTLPEPPTAIVASSDVQALGAYGALRAAGLAVPERMSVVGFDDVRLAACATPPLTTIRQPLAAMGRTAAELLLRLMAGETLENVRVELATTLVIRASSAPPPAPLPRPDTV